MDDNYWTSEERSLLARLPRTIGQDSEAEERLIFLLRHEGAFNPRERKQSIALRAAMFATAASFILGVLVGRVSTSNNEPASTNAGQSVTAPSDSSLVTVSRIIAM